MCIEFLKDQFIIRIFYVISSVYPRGGHRWKLNQFWKRSFMTMKSRGVQGLCNNRLSLTESQSLLSLFDGERNCESEISCPWTQHGEWTREGFVPSSVLPSFSFALVLPSFSLVFPYFFLRLPSCLPKIVFPIEKANIFLEWKLFLINRKWILMIIHS